MAMLNNQKVIFTPNIAKYLTGKSFYRFWRGCGCGEPLVQFGMAVAVDRQCSKHVSYYIDSNCLLEPLRMDDPSFGSFWFQKKAQHNFSGRWFGIWMKFMTFYILGISWSQLTFIFFRGVGIPPTRYYIDSNCLLFPDLVEVRYLTRLSILCFSWRVGTPILRWNMASGSSAPKNARSGSTPFRWWFCSVWCPFCFSLGRIADTLVNVYLTMENNNFSWKNSLFQWPWLQ